MPVPAPFGFVVKSGSKTRASVASSMPVPVSATSRRTYCPGRSAPEASAGRDALTVRHPPSGIASHALVARLSRICSTEVASMETASESASTRTSIFTRGVMRRSILGSVSRITIERSLPTTTPSRRRAKLSSLRVSSTPRRAA